MTPNSDNLLQDIGDLAVAPAFVSDVICSAVVGELKVLITQHHGLSGVAIVFVLEAA